jgi:uncharacterized protein YegP (UPF0339 family)
MSGTTDTITIYKDNAGEWRWRRKAINGRIVGASTEGYNNKSDCRENAERQFDKCTIQED